ncbi:MAG: DUF808 domain-containing protein [Microthrixaceae bacterium]|nr:DUF808 domain-containing protein [Microthrixaceae bacterium]
MAGGLVGLLDDIAALAKLAAASIDDVGAAASRASVKAAGVVVDDTAVTPAYVHGLAAERELPIIKRIAKGSLRNKIVIILPIALVLSAIAPVLVEIILMCGGTYLAFEGAEKLHHRFFAHDPADDDEVSVAEAEQTFGPEHEERTIAGAIRTDLILSAEIMVISLKEVLDEGIVSRAIILAIVAVVITVIVYGVVALIVKMDDAGLRLVERGGATSARLGRGLVTSMPKVLATLSSVGTVAMLWVGGHILVVGSAELGWEGPEHLVHSLEHGVDDVAGIGGVLGWCVNTLASAIVGLVVGVVVVAVATAVRRRRGVAPAH